ncbi:restriction endonuclease subunit S [Cuspidothrix issatschenkoi LEGE 03284]|uniref:restriction endonuclease subunit S n=1 Tax=Cuspidothrix issatschenkoi TaxID=230752 RepID=UPI00187E966C|nr:restriction endonuclease subunit S [Cuspidothrix issatschenkoi]MBE9230487.1 restriction endonuclease subunit S [Cuspidothrix issatschenkoi LEGE 03284]
MSVPDGFKVSEVGVIPEDWDVKKLGELVIKIVGGGTPSRNIKEYWNGKIYWATVKDLNSFNPCLTQETITKEGLNSSASNLIPKGNLIISTRMAVGKVVIYDVDVAINQDLKAICIKPDIDTQFLFFYFIELSNKIDFLTSGSTVKGIVLEDLKNLQIPLPSLPEQKAIAQSLSDVDTLITALDQVITKKRNIKQGTMQQLLTGEKRLPGFNDELEVKKLEDIADSKIKWSITGGPFGSNLKSSDYTADGIRIIQLQNIGDGIFLDDYQIYTSENKANELLSCNIYPGEIILSKMGDPVARACLIPNIEKRYLMCSDGIRLVVDNQLYDKKFIHDYINSKYFRNQAIDASTGSTRMRIGLQDLKKLTLLVPLLPEQQAIAQVLSDMDKEIEALEKKRDKYKAIKQGMMQELLTGKTRLISSS